MDMLEEHKEEMEGDDYSTDVEKHMMRWSPLSKERFHTTLFFNEPSPQKIQEILQSLRLFEDLERKNPFRPEEVEEEN